MFTSKHNLFPVMSRDSIRLRFPYPLDDCECGHYRIDHDAKTSSSEMKCSACTCPGFNLNLSDDEGIEVKTQAWERESEATLSEKTSGSNVQSATGSHKTSA